MQTNRQTFLELLQRYIDGTCSSAEKQMMDYWYDLLDQAPDAPSDNKQQEDKLWSTIQHRIQSGHSVERPPVLPPLPGPEGQPPTARD